MSESATPDRRKGADDSTDTQSRSGAEWVTLVLSIGIVAAMVGTVFVLFLSNDSRPAEIRASVDQSHIWQGEEYWLVPVTIENVGDRAATSIRTSVHATIGGETISREVEVPFLAGQGETEGIVVFPVDPRAEPLEVEVLRFREA